MWRGVLHLVCVLTLSSCGEPEPLSEGVVSTLSQADHAGFERAYEPRPFHFPEDHGAHRDYRDEWWYLTGNLEGPESRRIGFQLTFFRHGLKRGISQRPSAWAGQDVYMAHFTITDVDGRRFTSFQRLSRGAAGLAGARGDPLRVWLEDWFLEASPSGDFPWRLQAEEDGVVLSLTVSPLKPLILQGQQGLSRKSAEPGNASYYYSITRLSAQGHVRINGVDSPVRGLAWLDREWGTSMLADYQAGWDWFSLQLDDNSELMYFRIRHKNGEEDPVSAGSLVRADGTRTPLSHADLSIEVLDTWDSPAGGRYPARWLLSLGQGRRTFEIRPVLADQELRGETRYWEGAVDVFDAETGKPAGRGYVELTGYAAGKSGAK